jgi:hypothetical protein
MKNSTWPDLQKRNCGAVRSLCKYQVVSVHVIKRRSGKWKYGSIHLTTALYEDGG